MSLLDLQDVCIAIGSIATLDLPMVVDLIGIYGLKGPYCTLTTTNWFLQALSVISRGSWGDVSRRSYHDPMGKSRIVIPKPQWLWLTASCIPETLRVTQVLDSRFPHGYSAQCVEHEKRILGNHNVQFWKLSRSVDLIGDRSYDEVSTIIITLDSKTLTLELSSRRPSSLHKPPPPPPCVAGNCSGQLDEENPSAPISSGLLVQANEGVSYPIVDLIDIIYRCLP
ncbi:hypothetical protein F511_40960 [Dorcoceras hygrometricum]|uniref:Helicase domain-containing family protein n=1 Tax=Dorcoceras hygrometricum TaxID=472368 RepID=A0A2Z7CT38_9LAMI|nr:hypothetical protein F511_40960 [Dorcoceras hygrometricum]